MSVAVVVPFSSDEPWRIRARDYVVDWWESFGFDVVEGRCAGPWRKAVAVADAVSRCDADDVLVVADADCLCLQVSPAVAAVAEGAAWAMPHGEVHRLDRTATEAVYGGAVPADTTGRTQRPYRGWSGGGIVVLTRRTWEQVPMDPRFVGWSGEDESWAVALDTLAGPCTRLDAPLYHLWHPPQPRLSRRWGSHDARRLTGRYRAARHVPATMTALVDEARHDLETVAV